MVLPQIHPRGGLRELAGPVGSSMSLWHFYSGPHVKSRKWVSRRVGGKKEESAACLGMSQTLGGLILFPTLDDWVCKVGGGNLQGDTWKVLVLLWN